VTKFATTNKYVKQRETSKKIAGDAFGKYDLSNFHSFFIEDNYGYWEFYEM
jgi:hypothetical protein